MGDLLAGRPTPKLEDHPLSAVSNCLFNIFASTLHFEGRSSIRYIQNAPCHCDSIYKSTSEQDLRS